MNDAGHRAHRLDRAVWVSALLAVGSVVAAGLSPGVLTGADLLGAGTADTWGHAWGYGWTADALLRGELPFLHAPVDHPGSQRWWVIDLPVALMLVPFTLLAGTAFAYNLAMLGHLAVGAGATTALVRARGGSPTLAVLVGVMVVHSPFVRGVITSGVPEALGVLIVPLLVLWLDRGLKDGHRASLLGAMLVAVVLVLDGVYGALAGAWAAAVATGAAVWATSERARVVGRAAVVALPAAAAVGALRLALRASEHPALYDGKVRTVIMGEAWVLQPLGGSDLSAWSWPAQLLPLAEPGSAHRHIVYVGLVLPLAMAWAAWHQKDARRPLLVAGVGAVLALGPALFFWGEPHTSAILPGTLLWTAGATNLYRLAGLVPVMGLVGLALALSRLRTPKVAYGVLAAIAVEWVVGAPISLRLPTTPDPASTVEAWLADDSAPGAVLDLPFDREGSRSRGPHPQRTFYLASVHGRPVASGLYKSATMDTRNPALGALNRAVRVSWRLQDLPPGQVRAVKVAKLPAPLRGRAGDDLEAHLVHEGFSHVTMDLSLLVERHRTPADTWMRAWLGPPHKVSEDGLRLGWRLDPDGAGEHQVLEPVPEASR